MADRPEPGAGGLRACPLCGALGGPSIHRVASLPVNSCLLADSADEARSLPRGELDLVACERCGHLRNRAFREELTQYTDRYEDSQAFSPTFLGYAKGLAADWVTRWDLVGGTVVEIGAGRGDFARLLAEAGVGRVIAMDPTLDLDRVGDDGSGRVHWLARRFDASSGLPDCDAVVFRHVLEHVSDPAQLLSALFHALQARPQVPVLVEVPDAGRILDEGAFWDVYYEHCAYFVPPTLRATFTCAGFEVRSVTSTYAGQYLLVAATASGRPGLALPPPDEVDALTRRAGHFGQRVAGELARWGEVLQERQLRAEDVVLWGSGSKATAFLTLTRRDPSPISRVVDVNPHKQGRFVLGSGLPIVAPEALREHPCHLVIVMNPVYVPEITAQLRSMGVVADVLALGEQVAPAVAP